MRNTKSLIAYFFILIVFAVVMNQFSQKYQRITTEEQKNTHYVDNVLIQKEEEKILVEPYRKMMTSEVSNEVLEDTKELPQGVYHREDTLVLVPPPNTSFLILSVEETSQEIKVVVTEMVGAPDIQYGRLVLSNHFPIGVYNESGEYIY